MIEQLRSKIGEMENERDKNMLEIRQLKAALSKSLNQNKANKFQASNQNQGSPISGDQSIRGLIFRS